MTNHIKIRIVSEEEIFKKSELSEEEKELVKTSVEPVLNQIIEKCRFNADKGIIRKNEFCDCINDNIDSWLSMCCKGRTKRIFNKMKEILEEKKRTGEVKC